MPKILRLNFSRLLSLSVIFYPAVWALFVPGYFGASDDLHIAWLYEMGRVLQMGQIPPRFVPDLSFGFGYPLFNFVFPLPFYIAEAFHLIGFNLVGSIKAVFFISIPLSALFMYLFLRQFSSSKLLSLAGALLYVYTPYRAVDLYIRGAVGEILSFVFLPAIALSVIKLTDEMKGHKWIGLGGLALAGLILTHNITAYMFVPFVFLLFLLKLTAIKNKMATSLKILLMGVLGLLISCYFWLPALLDSQLVKYDTVFNFADHFPTLRQLVTPYWGYGASVPGPYDGMSFFLGIMNLAVLIIGILFAIHSWHKISKDKKIILIWAMICIVSALFLMNFRSSFVWQSLPFLPYFQFPWRFLIVITFAIPIFVIAFEGVFVRSVPILIILLTLATSFSYFRPQDFLGRMDEYYIKRYIPNPYPSEEYLKIQEEYLRLPKIAERRPDKKYLPIYVDFGQIKKFTPINDLHATIEVESDKGLMLNYTKYYFPGWMAKIDGKTADIKAGKPFGQIEINVAAGSHQVDIAFIETPFKRSLDAISLGSFLVSLLMVKNLWTFLRKIGHFS